MKTVSSSLSTELSTNVLQLALIVTLTRTDGVRFFLTNHDTPLTVDGNVYRNDISFVLSAIRSDSTLASDNATLDIGLDGVVFTKADFRQGVWKKTAIEIAKVNWADVSQGKIILRRGLFRETEVRGNNTVQIDLDGLLKVLDYGIGRTYVPACDAEFGDRRCRVAIDFAQHRSFLNPYGAGDWVYWYDETELTAQSITNGDFATDGDRSAAQAITGWTKSDGADFIVNDSDTLIVTHYDGDRVLAGAASTGSIPEDQFVYQDLTLGASSGDIDDGKIMFVLFVETAAQTVTDFGKVRVDMIDANGDVLVSDHTGWYRTDTTGEWREKCVAMHVPVNARTARVYLMTRRLSGNEANVNFANVRPFYWDITTQDPTHGLIFKATNVASGEGGGAAGGTGGTDAANRVNWRFNVNPGFEVDPARALSGTGTQDITGWTKISGQFKTALRYNALAPSAYGAYGLWSDDAHNPSVIKTRIDLLAYPDLIDSTDIINKNVSFRTQHTQLFGDGDANSDLTLTVKRIADDGTTVVGSTAKTWNRPTVGGGSTITAVGISAPIEDTTRYVDLEFTFGGSLNNRAGIDDVKFAIGRLKGRTAFGRTISDPVVGESDTVPVYTVDVQTPDGVIIWEAKTQHVQFDTVASVTSRKEFVADNMAGSIGDYTSTRIKWLSGANAGLENLVRIFTPGTQTVKMYYALPFDIQVGDRFMYTAGCQKRFAEDCKARFDNVLNFRGFPYVPGNVGPGTEG